MQIEDYEEKYRPGILLDHLDDKAMTQIVGMESNYEAAMEQLDRYYNNTNKVTRACMEEVDALPRIYTGDYKALVAYKKCIANSYTRLKAAGLEHEISNANTMDSLVKKLPSLEIDRWHSHKMELSDDERKAQRKNKRSC